MLSVEGSDTCLMKGSLGHIESILNLDVSGCQTLSFSWCKCRRIIFWERLSEKGEFGL